MVFTYTTCASEEEAKRLGRLLVQEGAAGCVNIFPIAAMYRDGGNVKEQGEYALLAKTIDGKVQMVEDIIRAGHSYQTPCIATLALHRLNREYKEWLTSEIV